MISNISGTFSFFCFGWSWGVGLTMLSQFWFRDVSSQMFQGRLWRLSVPRRCKTLKWSKEKEKRRPSRYNFKRFVFKQLRCSLMELMDGVSGICVMSFPPHWVKCRKGKGADVIGLSGLSYFSVFLVSIIFLRSVGQKDKFTFVSLHAMRCKRPTCHSNG